MNNLFDDDLIHSHPGDSTSPSHLNDGTRPEAHVDPVEEVSRESFPASDPPGWILQYEGDWFMNTFAADSLESLRQLASAQDAQQQARYQHILDDRDQVLIQAVTAAAKTLLKASGYTADDPSKPDNRRAIALMGDYLAQSSVPEVDQRLLALVGTDSLFGLRLEAAQQNDALHRAATTECRDLDCLIALRLAKVLNQSLDQEALLWRMIGYAINMPPEDGELVRAAIAALLNEIPVTELDDVMGQMVVNSVLGG